MDFELWTSDFGLWTSDFGLQTLNFGIWTSDFGLQTTDCGLWTGVGYEIQSIDYLVLLRSKVRSPKSKEYQYVTMDFELWTSDFGLG